MTNEQRYYDALKAITYFLSPTKLRQRCAKTYGLDYEEALKMSYENILATARSAIKGKRRPKESS